MQTSFIFTHKIFFKKLFEERSILENDKITDEIEKLKRIVFDNQYYELGNLTEAGKAKVLEIVQHKTGLQIETSWYFNIIFHFINNTVERKYKILSQSMDNEPILGTSNVTKRFNPFKVKKHTDRTNTWHIKKGSEVNELFGSRLFSLFTLSCKNKLYPFGYNQENATGYAIYKGDFSTQFAAIYSGKIIASKQVHADQVSNILAITEKFYSDALKKKGSGLAEILLLSLITNEPDLAKRNLFYNKELKKFFRIDYGCMFNNHPNGGKSHGEKFSFEKLNFNVLFDLPFDNPGDKWPPQPCIPDCIKNNISFKKELYDAFLKIYLYPRNIIRALRLPDTLPLPQHLSSPNSHITFNKTELGNLDTNINKMFEILDLYVENLKEDKEFQIYLNEKLLNKEEFLGDLIYQYSLGEDGHGYARISEHINDIEKNINELSNKFNPSSEFPKEVSPLPEQINFNHETISKNSNTETKNSSTEFPEIKMNIHTFHPVIETPPPAVTATSGTSLKIDDQQTGNFISKIESPSLIDQDIPNTPPPTSPRLSGGVSEIDPYVIIFDDTLIASSDDERRADELVDDKIINLLENQLKAYQDRENCSGFFKTFSQQKVKGLLKSWYENYENKEKISVKKAIWLIYNQLDEITKRVLPEYEYYGVYDLQFADRGEMLPRLEKVKEEIEKSHPIQTKIYRIIYMEFQKYLNHSTFGSSGSFDYKCIFGKNGYAAKIFNECCGEEMNIQLFKGIIDKYKRSAQQERIDHWKTRGIFHRAERLKSENKSEMIKTLDNIKKNLSDILLPSYQSNSK